VCGEHEIFGCQRTVLDDPRTLRARGDHNQHGRVIEDVKVWIHKVRPEMVGLRIRRHGREHMRFGLARDSIEHALIAYDRGGPWLLVYGAWRLDCRIDQRTDQFLVNCLGGIFAHRRNAVDTESETHMRLRNKVAIITGAGTGIGEAIAQKFAREGARLVLSGLPADPVQDVADAITNAGGRAIVHRGDLAEELHEQAGPGANTDSKLFVMARCALARKQDEWQSRRPRLHRVLV
jgi:short chain dehydrogenase